RFNGDDPAAVEANWKSLRACLPPNIVVVQLNQVHETRVHTIASGDDGARRRGDGLATREPRMILTVLSADCVPILMVDRTAGVVCALHAGWRGVLGDIASEGVRAMCNLGAETSGIEAAL